MIWLLVLVVHIAIEQIENKPNQHRMLRLDYNYDEMYDEIVENNELFGEKKLPALVSLSLYRILKQ